MFPKILWRVGKRLALLMSIIISTIFLPQNIARAASTFTVTNTNDSGPGSLRQAIINANLGSDPPGVLINFNILSTDPGYGLTTPGVWTIRPLSLLPHLAGGVTMIDGSTQTTNRGDTNQYGPEVEIDGVNLGPTGAVFYVTSGYNTIKGLAIVNAGTGVMVIGSPPYSPTDNTISDCIIGTDASAHDAHPNVTGIDIHGGAKYTHITNNRIAGNTTDGIIVSGNGSDHTIIEHNKFWTYTKPNNIPTIGNGRHGIFITSGPSETLISDNELFDSGWHNLYILSSPLSTVSANYFGGSSTSPGKSGISVEGGSYSTSIHDNTISFQGEHGIWIAGTGTTAILSKNEIKYNTLHGIAIYDNAGPVLLQENRIWHSGWTGVAIVNSNNNTLTGNVIGVYFNPAGHDDGVGDGNLYYGVAVVNGSGNTIGPGNWIGYNHSDGVRIDGATAANNRITRNLIYHNGGKGIHLVNGGNSQVMLPAVYQADCSMVQGMAGSGFTVEIFSDAEDEGRTYAGSTTASWLQPAFSWIGSFPGPNVTVTATDSSGNTSEFSAPRAGTCCRLHLPVTLR